MDERNSQYELQASRNGLTVPVINGVYLHSIYNPAKEAEAFIKNHEKNLKYKNRILVLGLGFGYHIEEIAKILNKEHGEYEIVVLEPNEQLLEDFNLTRPFEDKNIKIIHCKEAKELFNSEDFINFLMKKPAIIKHDASFIIEKDFYTSFLGFQASQNIISYKNLLNGAASTYIQNCENHTFGSLVDRFTDNSVPIDKTGYLLLALNRINSTYKNQEDIKWKIY